MVTDIFALCITAFGLLLFWRALNSQPSYRTTIAVDISELRKLIAELPQKPVGTPAPPAKEVPADWWVDVHTGD